MKVVGRKTRVAPPPFVKVGDVLVYLGSEITSVSSTMPRRWTRKSGDLMKVTAYYSETVSLKLEDPETGEQWWDEAGDWAVARFENGGEIAVSPNTGRWRFATEEEKKEWK